jgi:glycosyltransferase involved in cell wall biosynthesis
MMGPPKISAIVPAYNRSATVARAMESILSQRLEDLEVILVDDGSTDATAALVEGLGDPRVRILAHGENRGAAAARNSGIRAARGEFLAFLDSDDEWLPGKLELQLRRLEESPAHIGWSCTGLYLVFPNGEEILVDRAPRDPVRYLHGTCGLGPGSTLMVRRSCVDRVGLLDERFPRLEDWDWLLRLANSCGMAYLPQPLARVYKGSQPSADAMERSMNLFLDKHDGAFLLCGSRHRRQVVSRHRLRMAYHFYGERRLREGTHHLIDALRIHPVQNPVRLLGAFVSLVDAILGTAMAHRAMLLKRRLWRQ